MFFGKEEEPEKPKRPIRVTILTDEYIIDALDDPELPIMQAAYDSEFSDLSSGSVVLTDAYVKPLGNTSAQARVFPKWYVPSFVSVIAIVSDDPAAEDLLVDGWLDYEYPSNAMIYAGRFTIEGKLYSDEEQSPPSFSVRSFAPLEESVITYQVDKKIETIRGRWGVVNSVMMHGYSIE
jgi:hypothetical protein